MGVTSHSMPRFLPRSSAVLLATTVECLLDVSAEGTLRTPCAPATLNPRCNLQRRAHHCRRCGACVARMDHHCIYAANCVGAGNHKQFLLLLLYSGACAAHASFLFLLRFGCSLDPTAADSLLPFAYGSGDTVGVSISNGVGSKVVAPSSWSFARRGGLSWAVVGGISSLAIFAWLVILLAVQLYGIVVDAGIVDRMQQAAMAASSAEAKVIAVGGVEGGVVNNSSPHSSSAFNPPPGDATTWASTGVFRSVVDLPRGPAAESSSSGGVDGELVSSFCRIGRGASCCKRSWRTLREETLGEGPWLMWFVPSPAKLSPEIERRLYYTNL